MSQYYDPRDERPPLPRNGRRQSLLSTAVEALAGGVIIAMLIVGMKRLMGF